MTQHISAFGLGSIGRGNRVRTWLAGVMSRPEPVEMIEQRFNFLPQRFRWRGRLRKVQVIGQSWEGAAVSWRAPRRYFQVVCQDGDNYRLFQDLSSGTWHIHLF